MNQQETLAALDDRIRHRSILEHPFYRAWSAGTLTREQLATYAAIYYPHVAAFPGYLERAAQATTDPAIRATLEDNLGDELGNPAPHPALWIDFAAALGCDADAVRNAAARSGAAAIVDAFNRLAAQSPAAGIAALYAYESQQPEVAARKAAGLRELYGVCAPEAVAYFDVHAQADVEHRAGERAALERLLDRGDTQPSEVLAAADAALDAYWGLLDTVCAEAGIGCRTAASS